jgi:hypothetical protein
VGGVITGSLVNGPTFDPNNGGSIVFDEVDDYVDCGSNTTTKPTGSMTINYWFKGQSPNANASGVGTLGLSGNRGYLLGPNNGTTIYFFIASSSTNLSSSSFNTTIDINKWYCLTGVYNPSTYLGIYVNGIEVSNTTSSVPSSQYVDNIYSLKLGQRGDGYVYFDGSIAQFSIYHRALSASEVLQNYNALKGRYGL